MTAVRSIPPEPASLDGSGVGSSAKPAESPGSSASVGSAPSSAGSVSLSCVSSSGPTCCWDSGDAPPVAALAGSVSAVPTPTMNVPVGPDADPATRPSLPPCAKYAASASTVGRSSGSCARHAVTTSFRGGGTCETSGSWCAMRNMTASDRPVPNGDVPVAA